jgi:hypothetical protein
MTDQERQLTVALDTRTHAVLNMALNEFMERMQDSLQDDDPKPLVSSESRAAWAGVADQLLDQLEAAVAGSGINGR